MLFADIDADTVPRYPRHRPLLLSVNFRGPLFHPSWVALCLYAGCYAYAKILFWLSRRTGVAAFSVTVSRDLWVRLSSRLRFEKRVLLFYSFSSKRDSPARENLFLKGFPQTPFQKGSFNIQEGTEMVRSGSPSKKV